MRFSADLYSQRHEDDGQFIDLVHNGAGRLIGDIVETAQ